jgi:hypothetical protein
LASKKGRRSKKLVKGHRLFEDARLRCVVYVNIDLAKVFAALGALFLLITRGCGTT